MLYSLKSWVTIGNITPVLDVKTVENIILLKKNFKLIERLCHPNTFIILKSLHDFLT